MSMRATWLFATFLIALSLIAATPPAKPRATKSKAAPLTPEQRAIQALMRPMSLRDKVAQLVIVNANGDVYSTKSPDYEKYRHLSPISTSAASSSTTPRNTAWSATPSRTSWPCS